MNRPIPSLLKGGWLCIKTLVKYFPVYKQLVCNYKLSLLYTHRKHTNEQVDTKLNFFKIFPTRIPKLPIVPPTHIPTHQANTHNPNTHPVMNIFRFFGDLSHLASIFILLYAIEQNRSINGLSLKTQVLYVIVYLTRYLDLFTKFYSLYNTVLKIFFIGSSVYTVYVMVYKYQKTIKEDIDNFPVKYLVGASAVCGLVVTHKYSVGEVVWSFSLWLEALAILPQLFILQKTGEAENITSHYIFALGIYRALYIPNWIYRYFAEGHFDYVSVLAGILQTAIYSDFFYIYYTKVMKGKKFELPV